MQPLNWRGQKTRLNTAKKDSNFSILSSYYFPSHPSSRWLMAQYNLCSVLNTELIEHTTFLVIALWLKRPHSLVDKTAHQECTVFLVNLPNFYNLYLLQYLHNTAVVFGVEYPRRAERKACTTKIFAGMIHGFVLQSTKVNFLQKFSKIWKLLSKIRLMLFIFQDVVIKRWCKGKWKLMKNLSFRGTWHTLTTLLPCVILCQQLFLRKLSLPSFYTRLVTIKGK